MEALQACAKKKHFSELEKLIFCKASIFFKLLKKTIFQVPKSTLDFVWIGSSPSMRGKKPSLKSCFSAKPDFIPYDHIRDHAAIKRNARGIANPTYKE